RRAAARAVALRRRLGNPLGTRGVRVWRGNRLRERLARRLIGQRERGAVTVHANAGGDLVTGMDREVQLDRGGGHEFVPRVVLRPVAVAVPLGPDLLERRRRPVAERRPVGRRLPGTGTGAADADPEGSIVL